MAENRNGWFAVYVEEAGKKTLAGMVYSKGFKVSGFENSGEALAFGLARTLEDAASSTGSSARVSYEYVGARGSGFGGHG